MRKNDDLPVCALVDQPRGDSAFTIVILRGDRVIEHNPSVGRVKCDLRKEAANATAFCSPSLRMSSGSYPPFICRERTVSPF